MQQEGSHHDVSYHTESQQKQHIDSSAFGNDVDAISLSAKKNLIVIDETVWRELPNFQVSFNFHLRTFHY